MLAIASKFPFRMTVRLRLTLLYGAVFLIAGAALLGITYALFAHSINSDQVAVLPGPRLRFLAPNAVGLLGPAPGVGAFNPKVGSVTLEAAPASGRQYPRPSSRRGSRRSCSRSSGPTGRGS